MKIQIYDDDNMARVFDSSGDGICDIHPRGDGSLEQVDAGLKRLHMRRRTAWKHYPEGGFYEAAVRFNTPRTVHSGGTIK